EHTSRNIEEQRELDRRLARFAERDHLLRFALLFYPEVLGGQVADRQSRSVCDGDRDCHEIGIDFDGFILLLRRRLLCFLRRLGRSWRWRGLLGWLRLVLYRILSLRHKPGVFRLAN